MLKVCDLTYWEAYRNGCNYFFPISDGGLNDLAFEQWKVTYGHFRLWPEDNLNLNKTRDIKA